MSTSAAESSTTRVRRTPFAANPEVGTRAVRTQQAIVDAALRVFGEHGYERTSLERIAQEAGCSRITIYQYFAGKDDLFGHLAAMVARQQRSSLEALDPVTSDAAGVEALRSWLARSADIHRRFEPVFRAFATAAAGNAELFGGATAVGERHLQMFVARIDDPGLPLRRLEAICRLLLHGVTATFDVASILRHAAAEAYASDRLERCLAAVLHRGLFGPRAGVNLDAPPGPTPPALPIGPLLGKRLIRVSDLAGEDRQPNRRTLAALLDAGDEVITRRGYRGVRVDDLVAVGVSKGTFYRSFANVDDYLQVVSARAMTDVATALAEVPSGADRPALRQWLRRYRDVHVAKAPMIRVWAEAADADLRDDRAAVFDWGRRRLVRLLAGRGFGDVELDALVLLGMLDAVGSIDQAGDDVEPALQLVERGFLESA